MDTEWKEGVWLGHARGTNEVLIGTGEGVVRAYSVIRKPEGEQWNRVLLQEMQGTPQQPDPSKQTDAIPIKIRFDPPGEEGIVESKLPRKKTVRRMRLEQTMFEDYGYTEGCEGCRFQKAGMGERRGHNEECRRRMTERMKEDEDR